MPGPTINPISDPDEIRREAAANTPPFAGERVAAPAATGTSDQTAADVPSAEVVPEPSPVAIPATPAAPETPEQTQAAAPIPALVAPHVPANLYPEPTHGQLVQDSLAGKPTGSSGAVGVFSYRVPAGVYIIASFALAIALVGWVLIAYYMFNKVTPDFKVIALFVALPVAAIGILKANYIAYWSTILLAVGYGGYIAYDLLSSMSKILVSGSGIYGGFNSLLFMYYILPAALIVVGCAATAIYLFLPKVRSAF